MVQGGDRTTSQRSKHSTHSIDHIKGNYHRMKGHPLHHCAASKLIGRQRAPSSNSASGDYLFAYMYVLSSVVYLYTTEDNTYIYCNISFKSILALVGCEFRAGIACIANMWRIQSPSVALLLTRGHVTIRLGCHL